MEHRKLSHGEALALRRKLVGPVKLREIGQAYERYDSALVSRWDSYEGAIEAAERDPARLALCLRGHKPFVDGDQDRLATFISTKLRRCLWPRWLKDALDRHAEDAPIRSPTEEQYDLLADLVAKVGRKPHRVADARVHRAARLARGLLSLGPKRIDARLRTAVIAIACTIVGDESGLEIEPERVRNILDHPGTRDTKR